MTRSQLTAKAKKFIAGQSTSMLTTSLLLVDAQERTPETVLTRAWIIEELENRFPEASAAVEKAFDEMDMAIMSAPEGADPVQFEVDYVAILLASIPAA